MNSEDEEEHEWSEEPTVSNSTDRLMVVWTDDSGTETIEVGEIRDTSKSQLLSKRKKKSMKTFRIANADLKTSRVIVEFMNEGTLDGVDTMEDVLKTFKVAKEMGIKTLIDSCVDLVAHKLWSTMDIREFLGVPPQSPLEWEIECSWIYELL